MDSLTVPAHSTEPGYTSGRWVYSPLDKTPVVIERPWEPYSQDSLYHFRDLLMSYGTEQYGSGPITPRTTTTRS